MTKKIYEIWYDNFDGTQANLNGCQERIKVYTNKLNAKIERDRLNANSQENLYYIKEVELND